MDSLRATYLASRGKLRAQSPSRSLAWSTLVSASVSVRSWIVIFLFTVLTG